VSESKIVEESFKAKEAEVQLREGKARKVESFYWTSNKWSYTLKILKLV